MAKTYRLGPGHRAINVLFAAMIQAGLAGTADRARSGSAGLAEGGRVGETGAERWVTVEGRRRGAFRRSGRGPRNLSPYRPAAAVAADTAALGERAHDDQAAAAVAHGVATDLRAARAALVGDVQPDHPGLAGHLNGEPAAVPAGGMLNRVGPELHRDRDEVIALRAVWKQTGEPAADMPQLTLLAAEEPLPPVITVRT